MKIYLVHNDTFSIYYESKRDAELFIQTYCNTGDKGFFLTEIDVIPTSKTNDDIIRENNWEATEL